MSHDAFELSMEPLRAEFDTAGHPDEGTIHTWVDGAFDEQQAARVHAHVTSCASCAAAVAEARGLVAATSRVLAALDGGVAETNTRQPAMTAPIVQPRRWWTAPTTMRAAAALIVVVSGTWVWRNGRSSGARVVTAGDVAVVRSPSAPVPAAEALPDAQMSPPAPAPLPEPVPVPTPVAAVAVTPPPVDTASARAITAERAAAVERPAMSMRSALPSLLSPAAPTAAVVPSAVPAAGSASAMSLTSDNAAGMRRVVVSGVINDGRTMLPLAFARVAVAMTGESITSVPASARATTGRDGRFSVALRTTGVQQSVQIEARHVGYATASVNVRLERDSASVSVAMSSATMALQQVVTSPAPSAPIMTAADYSGRGVAGGIARGIEQSTLPRRVTAIEATSMRPPRNGRPVDREQYDRIDDNPFLGVSGNPLSTFSIDVDRASYGNVRRFLSSGQRPPKDAVRIEELINYFPYALPAPRGTDPVSITSEVMAAPWQPRHRLVRVALQAKRIETAALPPNNLVFLIDVSGSMNEWNKLPLVKQSLRLLVDQLRPQDRVAIVAYAGAAGLVLPSTSGDEKARIAEAIERLEAGGSTAGGAGIELAYRTAREHFMARGNNRVILATDGDFNVGVSSDGELERLIEDKRREGTYLTVLGYGTGNYQASKMEKLAKAGNGNHAYVDDLAEARKVLVEEMGATLLTVANDVKLQVEFNPRVAQAYRLIGYENRLLAAEDFNDDRKDAGDIGAGHQVTALYEVVPAGVTGTIPSRDVDSLRYTRTAPSAARPDAPDRGTSELLYVKLRYKRPGESQSLLMSHAVRDRESGRGSDDMRFVAAVAGFGMLLRDSEYRGNSSAAQVLEQARAALGDDRGGYRADFVRLVQRWRELGVTAGERR